VNSMWRRSGCFLSFFDPPAFGEPGPGVGPLLFEDDALLLARRSRSRALSLDEDGTEGDTDAAFSREPDSELPANEECDFRSRSK